MRELFSLGELYVSDFLKEGDEPRGPKSELKLMMEDDGSVRLEKCAPLDTMYGKYWYFSGINQTMKDALKDIVDSILKVKKIKEGDIWVDAASNDGSLLSFVPKNLVRIGIDPGNDDFKSLAEKHADLIVQDYFSSKAYKSTIYGKKKVQFLTSIAVFYDLEKPEEFIKDAYEILDDNGLWVMQLSWSTGMIQQLAFDNILHEHIYYHSLFNVKAMLEKHDFQVSNVELNDVNGGSMRLYITKKVSKESTFATQPYRDMCKVRVESLLDYEMKFGINKPEVWIDFYKSILKLKEQIVSFIKEAKKQGKRVWVLGGSTKGNSFLNFMGLDSSLIEACVERNPRKFGLRLVGSNIPIVPEEKMYEEKPDIILVLIWHFIDEIKNRHRDLLESGTQFVVACPKFEIINNSSRNE